MTILIAGEDYRPLHKWKYATKKQLSCEIKLLNTVSNEYIVILNNVLLIRKHYAWDGASFIARDTPNIMRASLFHDALCELIGEGLLDKKYRKYADQLFRKICLEDGMSKFRAWYVYLAVRGWSKLKGM